jgi:rare lipoprotein A (peptidoglycan hydrolase)
MKKLFLFFGLTLLFWPAQQVAAKMITVTPDQMPITIDNNIVLNFSEVDTSAKKLVIEWKATAEEGVYSLGVYPSQKFVSYTLQTIGGPKVSYKLQNNINADWLQIGQEITDHKLLVKIGDSLPINDQLTDTQDSFSSDNNIIVKAQEQVQITKAMAPVRNGNKSRISSFYKISSPVEDYDLEFLYQVEDFRSKNVYAYQDKQWHLLAGYNDVEEKFLKVEVRAQSEPLIIGLFADSTTQDGISSYYDQSWYRAFDYQNGNFAASRDHPKGTKLKVTRLKSGQSIVVEVNDYGPELWTGRIIDLDTAAFEQLGSLRAGLIYVKVEPYDQSN